MKAKPTTREDLGLVPEAQVNGRHVTEGTEVTVKGAGRFRFMYQRPNGDPQPVPTDELPGPVPHAGRTRHHRLVAEVTLDVRGELRRRAVAPGPVLLQRLHRDPVEITT